MLEQALKPFETVNVDQEFISALLNFEFKELEVLEDKELSRNCLALAQYLVYFKYQCNKTKEQTVRLKKFIDDYVFYMLTPELVKEHGTKANARTYLITNDGKVKGKHRELEQLESELILSDGLDKTIQEIINVLKKEISRRENELTAARYERRNR